MLQKVTKDTEFAIIITVKLAFSVLSAKKNNEPTPLTKETVGRVRAVLV